MPPGTYVLLIALPSPASIRFGAAGRRDLQPGIYAYVGSALGSGGLSARIERHRDVAAGRRDVRHWHVDHLLGHGDSKLREAVRFPGREAECAVATRLAGTPVDGLGASDCGCPTHLLAVAGPGEVERARRRVRSADT